MSADQVVIGIDVMIEMHLRPFCAAVAGVAFATEMPVVGIVFLVAADAHGIELVGERVFAMAVPAAQGCVFAVQHEARVSRVVEAGVIPARRRVAASAMLTAAPAVRIVVLMATEAGRRRALECMIGMAVKAGCISMSAEQGKAGRVVVEFDGGPFFR